MGRLKVAPPRLGRMPSRLTADRDTQGHSRTVEHWRGWYNLKRWRDLRMRVFERDLFTCQRPECGRIEPNTSLLVGDHIDAHQGDARLFWDERNVHTLCKPCHDKAKQAEEHRARFGLGHGGRGYGGGKSRRNLRAKDRPSCHSEILFSMTEKTAPVGADKDLFGDPWTPPRDPRGRKSHKRTAQVAEKVAVLRGTGATEEEIAARIGLSVPTLSKYYFRELKEGPALAQAMLDEVMYEKAMAGNVSAAKYMRERFSKGDASLAGARIRERALSPTAPAGQAAASKPGKKEERQADAERVAGESGRYAPPPAPTLVVNNR